MLYKALTSKATLIVTGLVLSLAVLLFAAAPSQAATTSPSDNQTISIGWGGHSGGSGNHGGQRGHGGHW